jgi:DnaJ-class molecular chaperone
MNQGTQNSKSYYEILGISPEASVKEIKKSYHELARLYHPDSNFYADIIDEKLNGQQIELFKIITSAYQTLIDPSKRKLYDSTILPPEREFSSDWDSPKKDQFWIKSSAESTTPSNFRKRASTFGQTGSKPFKSTLHGELKRSDIAEIRSTKEISKEQRTQKSRNVLLVAGIGLGAGLALSMIFFVLMFQTSPSNIELQTEPNLESTQNISPQDWRANLTN